MALAISIEGKGVIANADALTDDTGGTGTGDWGEDGGGGISLTNDVFLYGSSCIAGSYSNKSGYQYFDIGSTNELDFDTAGLEEGQHIYLWIHCPTIGLLETKANKGLAIRLGTSLNDYREYLIAGSDDANGWNGGWRCFIVDPTKAGSVSDTGSYDPGSIRYIGVWIDAAAIAKGDNIFIDQIAVGFGLRITGTSTTGWKDVVDYCTDYPNRAWGMFQEREGIYYAYGKTYIGDTTQGSATSFSDSGRIIQYGISEYWYSSAWVTLQDIDNSGIIVEDAVGYPTTFSDGIIVGTDNGRSGSNIIGNSLMDVSVDLYGGNHANSLTTCYGTVFKRLTGLFNSGNDSDHKFLGCSFIECSQFDPVGAPVIRNCIFSGYSGTESALLWNVNIDIKNCSFIANTDTVNEPHAIEHPSVGTFTYDALSFSGNDYDIDHQPSSTDVDNYNESNRDSDQALNATVTAVGQSVTGDGNKLAKIQFFLSKSGNPTGDAYAKLYAHSGTFGSSSVPTGAALAISNALDVSTLDGTPTLYTLEFEDPHYTLVNATKYVIVIEYTNGDVSNYVLVGYDVAAGAGHGGNMSAYISSWTAQANDDVCFHMFTGGIIVISSTNSSNPDEAKVEYTGSPTGVISINNSVYLRVYVKDASDNIIENAQVAIFKSSDETELMNEDTVAVTGLAEETFNYPGSDVDIKVKVRKSSPGDTYYEDYDGTGKIIATGFTANVRLEEDTKQT